MTRLTNEHREKICAMIVAHKFDPIEREFDKEKTALGERVYSREYGVPLQSSMREVWDQSPKGVHAFGTWTTFKVNAGGWTVEVKLKEPRPFLHGHSSRMGGYGNTAFSYEIEAPICQALQDYATRRKAMDAERKHLTEQVMGQLNPHFTFEKAVAAWPEIAAFANAVERSLPAPNLSPALADHKALNEALDLPPTKV